VNLRRGRASTTNAEDRAAGADGASAWSVGERVLILGSTPLTEEIARALDRHARERGHRRALIVGIVPGRTGTSVPRGRELAPLERVDKIIRETCPTRIIVDLDASEVPVAPMLESLALDVVVEDAVDAYERLTGLVALGALRPGHVIFSKPIRKGRLHAGLARAVGIVTAAIGLCLAAPLFLVLAIAIKLDSAGPVFFVHDRLGRGGRRFRLVKFRTMRPGAPRSEWVRDNGDRITRVGNWLRRFRLDELPQLLNVLFGDMDLVGPRPHPVSNLALFNDGIPFYPLRLTVRPGVTGWAQVQYGYANTLEEETEKMRYDLYYIKHRSVALDLKILFLTFKVVVLGRGVERVAARPEQAIREAA
jgi:lipopolysaccharide/colanic/teichoic acid biosynthesis glycosyltransferase